MDVLTAHGIEAILTRADHPSGSDRLAEACALLGLDGDDLVVNVQGDEPLMDPDLVQAVAALLQATPQASMGTAAHAITEVADFANPNVVKVVLDARNTALYFSRAPIAWWRDGFAQGITTLPSPAPLRHVTTMTTNPMATTMSPIAKVKRDPLLATILPANGDTTISSKDIGNVTSAAFRAS